MKKHKYKFLFIFIAISALSAVVLLFPYCRKIEPERTAWTTSKTLAGFNRDFGEPFGTAVKNNEIYISDGAQGKIFRIGKDGAIQLFSDKFDTPSQIVFDADGNLIVADSGRHTIKKVSADGELEMIAGVENQSGFKDGAANEALFNAPIGVAVFENKIYVSDTYNDKIRVIENGQVSTIGGEKGFADGAGSRAEFDTPNGLAVWTDGRILVADAGNRRIRVIEKDGNVWTLAGNGNSNLKDGLLKDAEFVQPVAVAVDEFKTIYVADGNAVRVIGRRIFPMVETVSNDRRGFADGKLKLAKFNRPSGLALDERGNLFIADSENKVLRVFTGENFGRQISEDEIKSLRFSPEEFRDSGEPRWSYDPPEKTREIAGTLGEIRGKIIDKDSVAYFHNGLDIVGGYGETARFIRDEKALNPFAAQNFGTLRELLRMPSLGYIHIRLGRDKDEKVFDDARFQFQKDGDKLSGVRVPRGAKFKAGESVGTLNRMNHVHLIAGNSGAEMNALDALVLPGISDKILPTIEKVMLFDENWREIETESKSERIKPGDKTRVVVRAYDRMDGNAERRRLGVFKVGYQILKADETPVFDILWTIDFERLPEPEAVKFVYAAGSRSGATGETIFDYIATNRVSGDSFAEDFLKVGELEEGSYILRVFAADFFGNTASKDTNIEVIK